MKYASVLSMSLLDGADHIARRRGLSVSGEPRLEQSTVPLHFEMVEGAMESVGFPVHHMASGAGHDAMILARKVPSAMLFLRSPEASVISPTSPCGKRTSTQR